MTRFQLVFRRDGERDHSELWDNGVDGEPHIEGKLLVEGHVYRIRGLDWIVTADGDHHDGVKRFVCTLVVSDERTAGAA